MSKVLTIPEAVVLKDLLTDEPLKIKKEDDSLEEVHLTFYQFLVGSPLREEVFSANAVTIMSAIDLKNKVQESKPGDEVLIDNETWDLLVTSVKEPKNGFNPNIALQIGSFFKAILDAEDAKDSDNSA